MTGLSWVEGSAGSGFDADHLPPPISLRQAGYDAITIIGRRAVPAPDLSGYVEMCLAVGMRVRCVLA